MTRMQTSIAALGLCVLLAACGGGGSEPPPTTPAPTDPLAQVPDSASASSGGLVSYLSELGKLLERGERAEPAGLGTFSPPQPDDTEPEPVS